ncbi:hypothetical protein [Ktedonospora formicarum]|uniref:Uncharacterized protein n=1 Tax=Ktedonospora formicarum TaxID=2778364 RepID=A0A8J3MT81_9CHLR|nr:hypothetical protein [Ktedonospora formicarum]GHO45358.1 hypothetical protein KSX_35210 [Ktedonospora formicarum]
MPRFTPEIKSASITQLEQDIEALSQDPTSWKAMEDVLQNPFGLKRFEVQHPNIQKLIELYPEHSALENGATDRRDLSKQILQLAQQLLDYLKSL